MSEWKYYPGRDALERMQLNDAYWEEQYERSKTLKTDESSLLLKICPTCGWSGRTGLTYCFNKHVHTHVVRLNIVPKDLERQVTL